VPPQVEQVVFIILAQVNCWGLDDHLGGLPPGVARPA
jgi:hypothetical protein